MSQTAAPETTLHFVTRAGHVISGGHEDRAMVVTCVARKNAAARRGGDRSRPYAVLTQSMALR